LVYRFIEFRDYISKRTAVMAKGDPTVHASGSLVVQLLFRKGRVDFLVIPQANLRITAVGSFSIVL
jgi:precorrin-3B methylase